MAQAPWLNWIEQPPPKGQVGGSNPPGVTKSPLFLNVYLSIDCTASIGSCRILQGHAGLYGRCPHKPRTRRSCFDPKRTPCLIPGCRRTTAKHFDEWICQRHWSSVSRSLRKLYTRSKKRFLRAPITKNTKSAQRFWERCKTAAINEALGIGN